ncbi:MAG: hypothetical protein H7096_02605 [Flavobacterium sp.]|nr:hypothetical protein [Pedobacter sp.]
MENTSDLHNILQKEGASEAFKHLAYHFNINDSIHIGKNWPEVEKLLLDFRFKRYVISHDFLFSEIIIRPFKTKEELAELKRYLLN